MADAEAGLASAQASQTVAQAALEEANDELSEAQAELTSIQSQMNSEIAELDTKRAQVMAKDHERIKILHQLEYDGLTEGEQSALEAQRDALSDEANSIVASYPTPEATMILLLDLKQTVKLKEAAVAEAADEVTIATANVTQQGIRVAACEANSDAQWLNYFSNGSSIALNEHSDLILDNTQISKQEFRYRVTIALGGYDIQSATSFTINWRERTYKADLEEGEEEEDTYTYVEKTATVTANPGEYEASTGWYTVTAPDQDYAVRVVGVAVTSSASLAVEHQGGSAQKRGIYGYTPSSPPRIYRRETITGGWAGTPSTDYDSERYYAEDFWDDVYEFSDDYGTANELANWPLGTIFQPATDEPNTGRRPATPTTESATAREFVRTRNGIDENIACSLSEEYTTAALKAEVDDLIGGDWNGGSAFTLPDALGGNSNPASIRFLSADELRYNRSRFRFKLRGYLPKAPTADMAPQSETFALTKYTMNLETGALSSTPMNVSLSFDEGESNKTQDDWTIIEAGDNELVWIEVGDGEERNHYEGSIEVIPPAPISYG
ncbi:hypothetical protein [Cerasicoccus maritimus]|uniref:hypothetical protein n=1 Tax=Cerasicoccus maritimus TaxID=490089 RepID=UPI0028527C0C|nr:hypothetical protein [Cerasicoccus maritimus]